VTRGRLVAAGLLAAAAAHAAGPERPLPRAEREAGCAQENSQADTYFVQSRYDAEPNRAVELAQEAAHAAAREQLCAGVSGLLCDARLQKLRLVEDVAPVRNTRGWFACAVYAFPTTEVVDLQKRLEGIQASLAATAAALPEGALHIEAPRWWNGADAGTAGAALREALVQQAIRQGRVMVAAPTAEATHVALRLTLTTAGEAVLTPVVEGPVERELQGFAFPTKVFGIDEQQVRSQLRVDVFGLTSDARPGASGLEVRLELATADRDFCEGDTALPEVRALVPGGSSTATELLLFSVDAEQNAILVARETGTRLRSPEPLTLLDTSNGRQEAFVAVAIPSGRPGTWSTWQPYCKLPPRALHASLFGAEAAMTFSNYTVHREGTGRCGDVDPERTKRRGEARAVLDQLPPCG
jgi:hypothetical protein